jgi:hypothetical protein
MQAVDSGLEVTSKGNAILLSPPTRVPQCQCIIIYYYYTAVILNSETFLSYSSSFSLAAPQVRSESPLVNKVFLKNLEK